MSTCGKAFGLEDFAGSVILPIRKLYSRIMAFSGAQKKIKKKLKFHLSAFSCDSSFW